MTTENTADEATSLNEIMGSMDLDEMVENPEVPEDAPINEIEPKTAETETTEEVVEAPPEYTPIDAPEFFSKENKELFAQLQALEVDDLEKAREIARQAATGWNDQYSNDQKYITQKSQKLADEKRQFENQLNEYNQIQQAIQGIVPQWQAMGVAPTVGLAQMSHYGQMLNTDVGALIQEIVNSPQAQQQGFTLDKFVEGQPYVDETTRALQNELQQLKQSIDQGQQAQQQQHDYANVQLVNTFFDAKDNDGNVMHPHCQDDSPHANQVRQDMMYWMTSPTSEIARLTDPNEKLTQAYNKAVSSVPEIQAEIQKAKEVEAAKARQEEAEKAEKASVSTSSKSKEAPKRKPGNINDIFADFSMDD